MSYNNREGYRNTSRVKMTSSPKAEETLFAGDFKEIICTIFRREGKIIKVVNGKRWVTETSFFSCDLKRRNIVDSRIRRFLRKKDIKAAAELLLLADRRIDELIEEDIVRRGNTIEEDENNEN